MRNDSMFCLTLLAGLLAITPPALAQTPSDTTWRLTSRLGYGPTPGLVDAIAKADDARAWALGQIDTAHAASKQPAQIPVWAERTNLSLAEIFPEFTKEREARKAGQEKLQKSENGEGPRGNANHRERPFSAQVAGDAAAWRLAACSAPDIEHPLLARMTEFWFNHLNVFSGKGPVRPFVGRYVIDVIRANAFGKYEDILLASAKHPAMLFYLDQAQSVADDSTGHRGNARGLNENYARELLELHTLGIAGGYSQNDVRELARILTGWTVAPNRDDGFRFNAQAHDSGEKRLLGAVFHDKGVQEGEDAIRMLARHPATARRIALRLASFFVVDNPPAGLVEDLARSFLDSGGDIRTTLKTLISSREFWQADQRLFKTPFDYACSALVATGGLRNPKEAAQAMGFLAQAGQPIHGWQTPDGYKTDSATWLSPEALTRRADFAVALGKRTDVPKFLASFLSDASRQRIAQEPATLHTGLMLSSPEFMRK